MIKKNLLIWTIAAFALTIMPSNCLAAENKAKQLQNINQLVYKKQQHIEECYSYHLNELQKLIKNRAKKINMFELMLWKEFVEQTNKEEHEDIPFISIPRLVVMESEISKLHAAMMNQYFMDKIATFIMDKKAHKLIYNIVNNNDHDLRIRRRARNVLRIMDEVQPHVSYLERQKHHELIKLQEWESQMKENLFKAKPETTELGVLTTIACIEDDPMIMVNGKILSEGDEIQGVKVLKIHREKVDFEKKGEKWTQKLGEIKEEFWQ